MKHKTLLIIVLILFTSITTFADLLTPEKLWSLKRIGGASLSPDGSELLFSISTPNFKKNNFRSDLFLVNIKTKEMKQLTYEGNHNSSACWSPKGDKIGFISDRSGTAQAYIMDLKGGDPKQLTFLKNGVSFLSWSPNGKYLAFASDVKVDLRIDEVYPDLTKIDAMEFDDLPIRHWDKWKDEKYRHLFVIPSDGGEPKDLMPGERYDTPLKPFGGASDIAWSPTGYDIAYTCKKVDNPESSTNSDVFLVSVLGGKAVNISEGVMRFPLKGASMSPKFSPDGKHIVFHSQKRAGFESDRIRLIDYYIRSARLTEITKKFDNWVGNFVFAPKGNTIYFSSIEKGRAKIFKINPSSGKYEIVLEGIYNYGDKFLDITPDGKTLILNRRNYMSPDDYFEFPIKGDPEDLVQLTDINKDLLKNIEKGKIEEKWITTRDSQQLQSWVVYPPNFDAKKKYPMITYCQGGPQQAVSQYWSFGWNFLLMASKGYIILAPNRRGCPGFGQKWVDAISTDWGGKAMNDILDATDAMLQETYIDKNKVSAIGGSAGGYTTFWLEGHNNNKRFKAFVSHCGVYNLESEHGSTEELWFPNWENGGLYLSKEARKNYTKNSPNMFSDNWNTPILIITAANDFRVPYAQSLQAFTLAQVKGIPSKLIFYPNENHWVLHPQEKVFWYREFFKFLDKYSK